MTGRWEADKPDPMAGMTDEQKEYEANQLLNTIDKLQRLVTLMFFLSILTSFTDFVTIFLLF